MAAENGQWTCTLVKLLIEKGANMTALLIAVSLHMAADNGHVEIVPH